MSDSKWVAEIEEILPKIQELALLCKEPFQQKCFEILLTAALQRDTNINAKMANNGPPTKTAPAQGENPYTLEYQNFLNHFGLDHQKILKIMDLESGKIYTKKFGTSISSRMRLLASLMALKYCAKEGILKVPKDELRQLCETYSSYDKKNFATIMKSTATDNKSIVFDDKGEYWKVTPPGEEYINEMIKGIIEP
jgi:hypothetical protein